MKNQSGVRQNQCPSKKWSLDKNKHKQTWFPGYLHTYDIISYHIISYHIIYYIYYIYWIKHMNIGFIINYQLGSSKSTNSKSNPQSSQSVKTSINRLIRNPVVVSSLFPAESIWSAFMRETTPNWVLGATLMVGWKLNCKNILIPQSPFGVLSCEKPLQIGSKVLLWWLVGG